MLNFQRNQVKQLKNKKKKILKFTTRPMSKNYDKLGILIFINMENHP